MQGSSYRCPDSPQNLGHLHHDEAVTVLSLSVELWNPCLVTLYMVCPSFDVGHRVRTATPRAGLSVV